MQAFVWRLLTVKVVQEQLFRANLWPEMENVMHNNTVYTIYSKPLIANKTLVKFAPNVNMPSPYGSTAQTMQLKHA